MIEVEMVQHDIETIAYSLFEIKLNPLMMEFILFIILITIFINNITCMKSKTYIVVPLFEVREERASIDFNKTFTNITTI
jgi:hypothetical protein